MIACLVALVAPVAQNARVRRVTPGTAPQAPELPADCAADGAVVNSLTAQNVLRANVTPNSTSGTGSSTDADGKWTISNITCGPAIFTAEKDGYIQGSGTLNPVTVVSGTPAHDLKIEFMPESLVTGRVLDDTGEPATSAQVRLVRSVVQNGRRTFQTWGNGTVDSYGLYRIGGIPAGQYIVCATYNRVRYPVGGGSATTCAERNSTSRT